MSGGGSAPAPPDYNAIAAQQSKASVDAVRESKKLNATDLFAPWGSTTYTKDADGLPTAQHTNLTSEGQYIYDTNEAISAGLGDLAYAKLGQIPVNNFSLDRFKNDPADYDFSGMQPFSSNSVGRERDAYAETGIRDQIMALLSGLGGGRGGQFGGQHGGGGMGMTQSAQGMGQPSANAPPQQQPMAMPTQYAGATGRPQDITLAQLQNEHRPLPGSQRDYDGQQANRNSLIATLQNQISGLTQNVDQRFADAAAKKVDQPAIDYGAWRQHQARWQDDNYSRAGR